MIAQPHPNFLINDNIKLIEGSVTIILVVKATYLDGKKKYVFRIKNVTYKRDCM